LVGCANITDYIPWLVKFGIDKSSYERLKKAVTNRDQFQERLFGEHRKSFDQENLRDFADVMISLQKKKG